MVLLDQLALLARLALPALLAQKAKELPSLALLQPLKICHQQATPVMPFWSPLQIHFMSGVPHNAMD